MYVQCTGWHATICHACMFQALEDAKVGLGDIASVEVTGGSSRVPALITHLRDFFGKEPSRTLNATEVVSRGCALNCAMLSPIFRCARGAPARCNGTVSRI